MLDERHSVPPKPERRLQAVLALFQGEPVAQVSRQYGIGRSDLYKFRARALAAMRVALRDHPRGPKRPHNRLAADREAEVVSICARHPTWSSYQIHRRLGAPGPSARTIQRIRKRCGLARLPKRAPPSAPRQYLLWQDVERARQLIMQK
jgi:hypothetical protein